MPDLQEAAEPQRSLNEAEKAEKKRAKKARQRAARAQAAAQTAEVRPLGSGRLSWHAVCPDATIQE